MRILGYNTWLHKYIAFVIAGGFGGLAGVLWAHMDGIVSPKNVVLTTSVDALLMVVLGGAGTLIGGVIGAGVVFCVNISARWCHGGSTFSVASTSGHSIFRAAC